MNDGQVTIERVDRGETHCMGIIGVFRVSDSNQV